MKVKTIVQDVDILKGIEPEKLKGYLLKTGWYEGKPFMNNATIWYNTPEKDDLEILLPNSQNLVDYVNRIAEVIETLAIFENRSQLDILNEIITTAPNQEVQGIITEVNDDSGIKGKVILFGVVFSKLQKIMIELLNNDDLALAMDAYQEHLPICCTGDLVKKEDYFVLKNPRNFYIYSI
ncbi:MAG TPA: hypothetical protein VK184_24830 [Nostocaceae cyanobacterium]|nr:hypothetical protein [Nostocaceae cyanobacterium]